MYAVHPPPQPWIAALFCLHLESSADIMKQSRSDRRKPSMTGNLKPGVIINLLILQREMPPYYSVPMQVSLLRILYAARGSPPLLHYTVLVRPSIYSYSTRGDPFRPSSSKQIISTVSSGTAIVIDKRPAGFGLKE